MEKFSVSVNIAAKSNVTFVLIYEELLQRKLGQYEILIRVTLKQPVQKFQVIYFPLYKWADLESNDVPLHLFKYVLTQKYEVVVFTWSFWRTFTFNFTIWGKYYSFYSITFI